MRTAGLAVLLGLSPWSPVPGQTARVCDLLPMPQLEAVFGGKAASAPKGNDAPSVSICGVNFADVRQTAAVTVMPPSPTDKSIGVEQRLVILKQADGAEKQKFESHGFGDIGCFRIEQDIGDKPLPSTTCFQLTGGYLALAIASDDPKVVSYDVVRDLLKAVAARRK